MALWNKNLNGEKRRHLNINYRDRNIWQQINFKQELSNDLKDKLTEAEAYLLKARDEDPDRNEWLLRIEIIFLLKSS